MFQLMLKEAEAQPIDFLPPPPPQQFSSSSENTSLFSATSPSSSEDLRVQSQDEDLPDSFEIESLLTNISCGKPFLTWFFEGISPKSVSALLDDINGICFYQIKVKADDWHRATRDKHHFVMHTTSHEGFSGIRRIGTCLGSFV